jgi:hypothetical protein
MIGGADVPEPLEPLARHLLREDRDRRAAEQRAVERAAAAEVPGRRPGGLVNVGIELSAHQPRHEAAERGADLVRAGREIGADQADDSGLHPGDLGGDLQAVYAAVEPRLQVVLPGDPEEVQPDSRPRAYALEPVAD